MITNMSQNRQIYGDFQHQTTLIREYQILDFIGYGRNAQVYKGIKVQKENISHFESPTQKHSSTSYKGYVAIKVYNKNTRINSDINFLDDSIKKKVDQVKSLDDTKVTKILDYFEEGDYFYVVNQFYGKTNLEQKIKTEGAKIKSGVYHMDEICALLIFCKIAKIVIGWHKQFPNFIHGNIKLTNLYCCDKYIKIGDFDILSGAHEDKQKYNISQEKDMQDLGVLLYQMLFGEAPFLINVDYNLHGIYVSENTQILLEQMICVDPNTRMNFVNLQNEINRIKELNFQYLDSQQNNNNNHYNQNTAQKSVNSDNQHDKKKQTFATQTGTTKDTNTSNFSSFNTLNQQNSLKMESFNIPQMKRDKKNKKNFISNHNEIVVQNSINSNKSNSIKQDQILQNRKKSQSFNNKNNISQFKKQNVINLKENRSLLKIPTQDSMSNNNSLLKNDKNSFKNKLTLDNSKSTFGPISIGQNQSVMPLYDEQIEISILGQKGKSTLLNNFQKEQNSDIEYICQGPESSVMYLEVNAVKYQIKLNEIKNSYKNVTSLELRESLGHILILDLNSADTKSSDCKNELCSWLEKIEKHIRNYYQTTCVIGNLYNKQYEGLQGDKIRKINEICYKNGNIPFQVLDIMNNKQELSEIICQVTKNIIRTGAFDEKQNRISNSSKLRSNQSSQLKFKQNDGCQYKQNIGIQQDHQQNKNKQKYKNQKKDHKVINDNSCCTIF